MPASAESYAAGAVATVVVRRRVGAGGRLAAPETLATHDPLASFTAISKDGRQLFFDVTQSGETSYWEASRGSANGVFQPGRILTTGKNPSTPQLSPGGGWVNRNTRAEGGGRSRIEVEPFGGGGTRRVLDPSAEYRDIAFASRDDSVAIATRDSSDKFVLTVYPLPSGGSPSGASVRQRYSGQIIDLEWLSDGRFASPLASGREVRVFSRNGETRDFPFPDSLGVVTSAARSPTAPALALLSSVQDEATTVFIMSRMDVTTGAVEREEPPTFTPNARFEFLSHDARRAIISAQSFTTDVAKLSAAPPNE